MLKLVNTHLTTSKLLTHSNTKQHTSLITIILFYSLFISLKLLLNIAHNKMKISQKCALVVVWFALEAFAVPKLVRKKRKEGLDNEMFNFLVSEFAERGNFDDLVTYTTYAMPEEDERSGDPSRSVEDLLDFDQPNDEPVVIDSRLVDCASSPMPMKAKPKKRVWRAMYSQYCHGSTGQVKYPPDCHAYVDCWRGRGTKKKCFPADLVFNPATSQCDWASNVPCIEMNDKGGENAKIDFDMTDCGNYTALGYKCVPYWQCSDSGYIQNTDDGEMSIDIRGKKQVSRKGGMFDPLTKRCSGAFEICCQGMCKETPKKIAEKHYKLCPGDFTGKLPYPSDCMKFIECWKGNGYVMDCPAGTEFCEERKMCNFPQKVVNNCHRPGEIQNNIQPSRGGYIGQEKHARSRKVLPAPPSGQKLRLRQGRSPSEGYLQLYHNNKWGFVCDSGSWTLEEANIVCSQLGFTRGVRKTTQGLIHGPVDETSKITEYVNCTGGEPSIDQCNIIHKLQGRACKLSEDIVSIACIPDSMATCREGEIPWGNACYKFHINASSFHDSQAICQSSGGHLLEIESQEENDMISELLYQTNRLSSMMDEVWTGGVNAGIARKSVWFWHSDTDKPMDYKNFWAGWSGGEKSVEQLKDSYGEGIKLVRKFPFVQGHNNRNIFKLTDYYFWMLESFATKLSFVCERPAEDIGCISGGGGEYQGPAKITAYGGQCKNWESEELEFWLDSQQVSKLGPIENNNFCRNPDESTTPWCLVGDGEYEDCDIPQCYRTPQQDLRPPPSTRECNSDEFSCQPGECIFSAYVCDHQKECANGADEEPIAQCGRYSGNFNKVDNVKLDVEIVERWTNREIEACLRDCVKAKDFTCRGVNYDTNGTCILLEANVGLTGQLEETFKWNYYERIETQVVCDQASMCESGKCLEPSQICDGKYDCPDKKDESACPATPAVQIRLTGGQSLNEGMVEVMGFDHSWGGICDDGFGISEANVVCRHAGFPLGAAEAVLHSGFGSGSGIINIDELDCVGDENDIMECKSNPWTEHDCSAKEMTGVVCKSDDIPCTSEEWRCKTGECINMEFLCDSTSDCSDGSDETPAQCQQKVEVRLVGGNNITSGRLEVLHKGVWGTVCDDNFGKEEGRVVCNMLGYPGSAKVYSEAAFGAGEGPIWINNILCNGTEASLVECPAPEWGPSYRCKHLEDVGVECLLRESIPEDGEFADIEPSPVLDHCATLLEFKPPPPVAKVSGGMTAAPGSTPWTASIRVRGNTRSFHWCGAVLIGKFHFLTAAHCVEDYPKDVYVVRVGDWDQEVAEVPEQEFNIKAVHFHPEFNVGTYLNNDIAVISIKEQDGVVFSDRVKPACLPQPTTSYTPGMSCSISGWGSLGHGSGGYSRRLQAARVPLLQTSQCMAKHVYGPDKLSGGMFCAGYLEGGVDSCQGDSGGPMVCENRGKATLFGVISWGYGCGRPNKPGVYTKVVNYLDWIQEMIETQI